MPYRFWLKLAAIVIAVALCVGIIQAWRADRRDRAQLAGELAATKQLLAAADARQKDRDAQLAQTLAAIAAEKRAIVTPAQILRELPKNIPLPAPITFQDDHASSASVGARFSASRTASKPEAFVAGDRTVAATNVADTPEGRASLPGQASPATTKQDKTAVPSAIIPAADLKPLYDFALDCKACQAKLSAAQNDLADERQKTAALTKERNDALRLAAGGSAWRRVARAAKWFVLGAAAGALAAKSAH